MNIQGMPQQFWVVLKPTPGCEMVDVCFACTFGRLLLQGRGGLKKDEIAGIYANKDEAEAEAMRLLGQFPVSPLDSAFFEILVKIMVQPKVEGLTARDLGAAAVEAVADAVGQGEKAGFRHRLGDRAILGAGTVELKDQIVVIGWTV